MLKMLFRQSAGAQHDNSEKALWELLRSVEYQIAESKDIFNFSDDDELIAIMHLKNSYLSKYREYILSQLTKLKQPICDLEASLS